MRYTGIGVGFELGRRDVLLLVGLGSLILLARLHFDDHRVLVGEIAAFLALALLLARHPRVRITLRRLDPRRRLLVVLLPALVVVGQVVNLDDRLFPFVTWELYTSSIPSNPAYHDYTAAFPSGRVITLPQPRLFPSLGGRVGVVLEGLSVRALHSRAGAARARATARLEALLRALAREHERQYAEGPIRAIDIWHRTIPTMAYEGRASIAGRHERRVEVP